MVRRLLSVVASLPLVIVSTPLPPKVTPPDRDTCGKLVELLLIVKLLSVIPPVAVMVCGVLPTMAKVLVPALNVAPVAVRFLLRLMVRLSGLRFEPELRTKLLATSMFEPNSLARLPVKFRL